MGKSYRNSPVIGDGGVTATPAEISNLADLALSVFNLKTPDLHNVDEVRETIQGYFETCRDHGTRPGNLGLYAALGMSKQDYNNALTGKTKNKVSPACLDLIKKAARAVGAYREGLAMENKLHPTTYIFMGKNYDGLEDQTKIEVQPGTGPQATLSPEEIRAQIEKDIPIDGDYREE